MKDLNEIMKDIERDLVINLTISLRHKKISKTEARNIAREFINDFPYKDEEAFFEKLNELSGKFWVVRKVYVKYAFEYEDEKIEKSLIEMRNYMKIKDFENAIRVAKGGV